jgi:hypothetical protein
MSGWASAMAICGRAAAVFVHRETQHIVSGLQAYARQPQPVKKSSGSKTIIFLLQFPMVTRFC